MAMMNDNEIVQQALALLAGRMAGEGVPLMRPLDLLAHAALELREKGQEVLLGYWLDSGQRLIGFDVLAIGSETTATFSMREAARRAIAVDARGACFIHNHPGDDPTPSAADRKAAASLDVYFAHLGILITGHYVVAGARAACCRSGTGYQLNDVTYAGRRCKKCNAKLDTEESCE